MWNELNNLHGKVKATPLTRLFAEPGRAERFSVVSDGLLFDYSKTSIDVDVFDALIALARENDVEAARDAMLRGDRINSTEDRSVLHTAMRLLEDEGSQPLLLDGQDALAEARAIYARQQKFATEVRNGTVQGTGGVITDVVNVGIGGSDLGPAMAYLALAPYADGPRCHFVSNVDGADLHDCLGGLDPTTTLVIVASKTFTTQETMMNARSAREWMRAGGGDPKRQFVAISTALDQTEAFGIPAENVFGFENWVGGRYSVWSPIGMSLMLATGPENFADFLRGGLAMDRHFAEAPLAENMPVLLALVGLWHQKICGYGTRAVIPYENRLARLPAYLQQLEMESNGKGVGLDGAPLARGGGPVVWGEPGTNGQHAFFQLLHQGRDVVPIEFLVGAAGHEPQLNHHHNALLANCLAQSEALLRGKTLEEARNQLIEKGMSQSEAEALAPHKVFPGNRPSTTLMYPKLSPFVLGQIIALYEHRVFVEGVILGLNSFDQWGVELGKEMASGLVPAVSEGKIPDGLTGSTLQLLAYLRENGD